jgi:hypothetical protein
MTGNAFFALAAFWLAGVVSAASNSTTTKTSTTTTIKSTTASLGPSSSVHLSGTSTYTAVITNTIGASIVKSTTVVTIPYGNATITGGNTTPGFPNNPVRTSTSPPSSTTPSLQNSAPGMNANVLSALAPAAIVVGGYFLAI